MLNAILLTLLAGIAGACAMSAVMYGIHAIGAANADMVRALGSIVTRKYEGSFGPGLVIHAISGAMFAFPYSVVLGIVPASGAGPIAGIGALMGFFHGFVVSFLLIAMVAESHPVEQFRRTGISVAVAHIFGHIVYGAVVGLLVAVLHISLIASA